MLFSVELLGMAMIENLILSIFQMPIINAMLVFYYVVEFYGVSCVTMFCFRYFVDP